MKNKTIKILKILQIIVSIITICLIFAAKNDYQLGMVLPDSIAFLPATLFIITFGLFIAEFVLKRANYRLLLYYGEIILAFSFVIGKEYYLANTMIMFYGILNAIVTIISYITSLGNEKIKTLPISFYTEPQFYLVYGLGAFYVGANVILYFLFAQWGINVLWLFAGFPIFSIIFIASIIIFNPLRIALGYINTDLKYEEYSKRLDALMSKNLHPESRAYLETVRANYMLVMNKNEALKYYETVSECSSKTFIVSYALVKANFASISHNGEEFGNAISLLETYCSKSQIIDKAKVFWKLYNTQEEIENIESIYSENEVYAFSKLSNKYGLMYYYSSRGKVTKAKEIAEVIKDCPFEEYRKNALKVLNGEKI